MERRKDGEAERGIGGDVEGQRDEGKERWRDEKTHW